MFRAVAEATTRTTEKMGFLLTVYQQQGVEERLNLHALIAGTPSVMHWTAPFVRFGKPPRCVMAAIRLAGAID